LKNRVFSLKMCDVLKSDALTLLSRRFKCDALNASLLSRDVEDVVAADEGVAVLALQLPVHVLLGLEGRKVNYLVVEVSDSGK
jgi:hypothetical protein